MGEWRPVFRKSRSEQVAITRLCIGQTRLVHSFLLRQEQQLQCLTCQRPCTIKYVLLECKAFNNTRKHFFQKKKQEGFVWERPYGWRSIFLERDRIIPKNINFGTILKTQATNQPSAKKLLLNSNNWNH